MKFHSSPVLRAAFLAAVVSVLSLAAGGQTISNSQRVTESVNVEKVVTLQGNTHPLARPENDRGAAPDSLPMNRILLVLQRSPEQETALRQLMDEQQIKSSSNYHKWLTPEEFGKQFGPSDADVQATSDWLSSQGFQVNRIAAGRTVIEFSGTAGQVRQALHTEIHKYTVNGVEHWANASDPQIPVALSPVVAGIASLNNFPRKTMSHQLGTFSRSKITGEVRPLFTFTDSTGTNFAIGPTDFATIYNVLPLYQANPAVDGTGQTIAIVADSNINIQDARDFRTIFGLPANDPVIVLDGPDPGIISGSESEADLDVQWSGAVAKNATIKLVVSADTETSAGADLSALYIVDNNLAPVMSDSFGTCEVQLGNGGNAFYSALWEQAAAEGITVLVASGDSGSAECDDPNSENAATRGLAVDGLASTPFNISVGGTDFNDVANPTQYWNSTNSSGSQLSAKSYIPEVPWNDSCARLLATAPGCSSVKGTGQDLAAGGGGTSILYPQPTWQTGTGTGVPNDGKRHSPDVSLFAADGVNGNFYVFCEADANTGSNTTSCNLNAPFQNFQGAGGTSFAAPAFAGIMALVNQKTGARQGNANYVLYPLAAKPGNTCDTNAPTSTCIFYDTTTGNIDVACAGGSPNCSNTTKGTNQFGVLLNPTDNTLKSLAWATTPGYDMATGLGTVNAANLVNNWASNFLPTTTTLVSLNPTSITHGQSVNVSITVTGGGTPTGDVTLANSSNVALGIPPFTLSGGAFNGTTKFLPGGTYSVTAHYAGDGKFAASNSTPPGITVTVNPESSQTHLALITFDQNGNGTPATTAAYGSPYVLRGDVTNSSALSCASPTTGSLVYPCPTGVLTITDNGALLDSSQLGSGKFGLNSQGYSEDILIQLPPGSHNLVAAYSGDASFGSTTSATDPVTITPAATTIALAASASTVSVNASVTLTATLSTQSNGAAPAGTVTFLNGTTPISGTVSYVRTPYSNATGAFASLQATLTTSFPTPATDTITAQFGSDSNYASSSSAPVSVTVTSAPPGFTLAANPGTISISSPGQSGTSTLTLTPTNGFTGAVNFTCTVPAAMAESTCSMSPSSVTTSGSTALTVTTTAPHTVGSILRPPSRWLPLGGVILVVCLMLLSIPVKRRRLKLTLGLTSICLMAAIAVGCGGGSSSGGGTTTDPGTPAGTYSVTVTATSGAITQTATVSVTVL